MATSRSQSRGVARPTITSNGSARHLVGEGGLDPRHALGATPIDRRQQVRIEPQPEPAGDARASSRWRRPATWRGPSAAHSRGEPTASSRAPDPDGPPTATTASSLPRALLQRRAVLTDVPGRRSAGAGRAGTPRPPAASPLRAGAPSPSAASRSRLAPPSERSYTPTRRSPACSASATNAGVSHGVVSSSTRTCGAGVERRPPVTHDDQLDVGDVVGDERVEARRPTTRREHDPDAEQRLLIRPASVAGSTAHGDDAGRADDRDRAGIDRRRQLERLVGVHLDGDHQL